MIPGDRRVLLDLLLVLFLVATREEGDFLAVDFLLTRGVDVNARHNNGMTALMIAVQTGQRETVQLLLGKGADAKVKAGR